MSSLEMSICMHRHEVETYHDSIYHGYGFPDTSFLFIKISEVKVPFNNVR